MTVNYSWCSAEKKRIWFWGLLKTQTMKGLTYFLTNACPLQQCDLNFSSRLCVYLRKGNHSVSLRTQCSPYEGREGCLCHRAGVKNMVWVFMTNFYGCAPGEIGKRTGWSHWLSWPTTRYLIHNSCFSVGCMRDWERGLGEGRMWRWVWVCMSIFIFSIFWTWIS